MGYKYSKAMLFSCCLQSLGAHMDHFVRCTAVHVCVFACLFSSHTFLVVIHSFVSQATHAFLGLLPLFLKNSLSLRRCKNLKLCPYFKCQVHTLNSDYTPSSIPLVTICVYHLCSLQCTMLCVRICHLLLQKTRNYPRLYTQAVLHILSETFRKKLSLY